LHQLLATFHQPGKRILIDEWSFPSDRYAIASHLPLRYQDPTTDLIVVSDRDGLIDTELLLDAMDHHVGMAVLPAVAYRSGQLLDISRLTHEARGRNVLVAWDCSHSAGVIPHRFRADDIDLAFGCTYKYLNGGPGAPAFAYIAARLHESMPPALRGWMGHRAPFALDDAFAPAAGARRYSCGTPEVLGLSVLDAALDVFAGVDMGTLRDKAVRMSELFIELVEEPCHEHGLALVSPRDPGLRGSHVALEHRHAYPIMQALIARGVIGDFRAPNLLRFGFAPLYQSYADVWRAAQSLRDVLMSRAWDDESFKRVAFVT